MPPYPFRKVPHSAVAVVCFSDGPGEGYYIFGNGDEVYSVDH